MKDDQLVAILENAISSIESDLNDWDPADSNNYLAYGPEMKEIVADLYDLLHHFKTDAKFEEDLAKTYNETWPDFVDGNII
jgi:hypothetical protein